MDALEADRGTEAAPPGAGGGPAGATRGRATPAPGDRCRLPGGDIEISRGVLGTMTWGTQVDERAAGEMVRHALDQGVTTFDTANKYGDGEAERLLGKVLRRLGAADAVVVSKVGHPSPALGPEAGLSKDAVRHAVEASLRRLGRDVIDVYLLHMPDRSTPIDDTLEALAEAVSAGKVRAIGHSNYAGWQAVDMAWRARVKGWPIPRMAQPMYNLIARRLEREYADASRAAGLVNIVYNPLAGGLLTGKHRRDAAVVQGSRFTREDYRDRYWSDPQFAAVDALRVVAADAGLSLVELSLRWLAMRPAVDAIVYGASTPEHLKANLAAVSGPPLDERTLERCDEVWRVLDGTAPNYNR